MKRQDMIFETILKLGQNERRNNKQSSYIYLDETENKIKERPLKLDSAAGASINHSYKNPAKLIHDAIFR
jgi:hypothetical protein